MLYDFILNNRSLLIAQCIGKVAKRFEQDSVGRMHAKGFPLFLDQLVRTLVAEDIGSPGDGSKISGPSGGDHSRLSEMGVTAAAHGKELLRMGYSVDQVVHEYGDLCQAITELAVERDAPFSINEFRVLNRCLDNAIADAVTEFSTQRDVARAVRDSSDANEQLGFLMHELRNSLSTATLAVTAMETGNLTLSGATGTILKRSLLAMNRLIQHSLIETRSKGAVPEPSVIFSLAEFIAESADAAQLDGRSRNCAFNMVPVDPHLNIKGIRELLLGALANLLTNAFKFTKPQTAVTVHAYAVDEQVLIDVSDHCGGIPQGDTERLFTPFGQYGNDRTGAGLGLSIARHNVTAAGGTLTAVNKPGIGCTFTIALPLCKAR